MTPKPGHDVCNPASHAHNLRIVVMLATCSIWRLHKCTSPRTAAHALQLPHLRLDTDTGRPSPLPYRRLPAHGGRCRPARIRAQAQTTTSATQRHRRHLLLRTASSTPLLCNNPCQRAHPQRWTSPSGTPSPSAYGLTTRPSSSMGASACTLWTSTKRPSAGSSARTTPSLPRETAAAAQSPRGVLWCPNPQTDMILTP